MTVYNDFVIGSEDMRLKSASIREAVAQYMPTELFGQWMEFFVSNVGRDLHRRCTSQSLDNVTEQFNLVEPGVSASPEVVRFYLDGDNPNFARMALNFSDMRYVAYRYPKIVLALALFQASHTAYLGQFKERLRTANLSKSQLANAKSVLDGPFETFKTFVVFGTLLPLILLKRSELEKQNTYTSELKLTTDAIGAAWELFIKKKLLRRNFENGSRMICPANQHLRMAKDRQLIEKLYGFVHENRTAPVVADLLKQTRIASLRAIVSPSYYHWHYRGEAFHSNRKARGGQGL